MLLILKNPHEHAQAATQLEPPKNRDTHARNFAIRNFAQNDFSSTNYVRIRMKTYFTL